MLKHSLNSSSSFGQYNQQPNRFTKQIPIFERRQRLNSLNNCVIEKKRGYKPSDCFDPVKKNFLLQLSRTFWCKSEDKTPSTAFLSTKAIDLKKIFTPAKDAEEIIPHKNRKNENVNGYSEQKMPAQQFGDQTHHESKTPLKLVMDPRGVLQDVHTQGITFDHNSGMLSPDKCAELVSALHTESPKGKGAELFAKRRKRSEKWIVDETTRSANNPTLTSYSAGPAPIYDTYQSSYIEQQPWGNPGEIPLRNDFSEENNYQSTNNNYNQDYQTLPYTLPKYTAQPLRRNPNSQRDLAYKPSIPQGWNAPPANLPNELFTPPEIPLSGYTPPETDFFLPKSPLTTSPYSPHQEDNIRASTDFYHQPGSTYYPSTELYQHQFEVMQSCKNVLSPQICSKNPVPKFTPKPFTPSPIAHEKLAVFESNKTNQPLASVFRRPLTIPNQTVHNLMRNSMGFNASYDNNQNATWQNSSNHNTFVRLSTSSAMTLPQNYNSLNIAMKNSGLNQNVSYQENHNRAARGWGHPNDYYRPISFTRQQPVELPYSDF